jgi:hypothetical protein
VTLPGDLHAFQEHRRCGELDAAAKDDGVWMTYTRCSVANRDADR